MHPVRHHSAKRNAANNTQIDVTISLAADVGATRGASLLRGIKGALLTPVADVVQVENPYGIAFACSVAALFSDQIIAWLSKLVGALPTRGP